MTIKDAEKLTGLTAKSIRYYETKGLIQVKRNQQNDYRNYTEEDIQQLKRIKVLRYLEFTIEEIADILQQEETELAGILQSKSRQLEAASEGYLEKQRICDALLKDSKKNTLSQVIDDYSDTVEFLESSEGEEFTRGFLDAICPSFSAAALESLILSGPILWLFIHISQKRWDMMLFNSIAALICTVSLALIWGNYFKHKKQHKQLVQTKNKGNILAFPILILLIVAALALVVCIDTLIQKVMAPEYFLFYQMSQMAEPLMVVLIVLFLVICLGLICRFWNIKGAGFLEGYVESWNKLRKGKIFVVFAFLAGLYYCLTSVTFVTEKEIICHSFFHPFGVTYTYEDVETIETGFGGSYFTVLEYQKKGQFYYQVVLDGRTVTFTAPTVNEKYQRYVMDTYLELEEFDSALVDLGIPKESSEENWKSNDLDTQYVERFLRIVRN